MNHCYILKLILAKKKLMYVFIIYCYLLYCYVADILTFYILKYFP